MYCSPNKVSQQGLPPTKDELNLHVSRACYQTAIWRKSDMAHISAPSPSGHGWIIVDDHICIKWMTRPAAPKKVLQDMFCKCKTGCKGGRCNCNKEGMRCTDLCQCTGCGNRRSEEAGESDGESDVSDESDSEGKNMNIITNH